MFKIQLMYLFSLKQLQEQWQCLIDTFVKYNECKWQDIGPLTNILVEFYLCVVYKGLEKTTSYLPK